MPRKDIINSVIVLCVLVAAIALGVSHGFVLDETQLDAMKCVVSVMLVAVLYCFVVGEISRNNSQMDKLWSILPILYAWIIAAKGGMTLRLVAMAALITIWGMRLTGNFARKGAYSLKFWTGEEDYRWPILRKNTILGNKFVWALFDLFFISFYQNALVLAICFPMIAVMSSSVPFGFLDMVASLLMGGAIIYETIADEEQMEFQTRKWAMIRSGRKLQELPPPYNKGFNTTGLFGVSRHPNYLAEQSTWVFLYLFTIGAGEAFFNWSVVGCALLVMLFLASSVMGEVISSGKYPEYREYQRKVNKYLPGRRY